MVKINPFTVSVIYISDNLQQLTHFKPILHFFTPLKRQRAKGFLTFLEGMEMKYRSGMV